MQQLLGEGHYFLYTILGEDRELLDKVLGECLGF